jgi:DNA-binding MarR family transcriptional regulator
MFCNSESTELGESAQSKAVLEEKASGLREVVLQIARGLKGVDEDCAQHFPKEMNLQELRVLEVLGERGSCIMRELADGLVVAVSTVTGIVDKMVQKDLVHRERVDEDRRIVRAELSPRGREVFAWLQEQHLLFCRRMLAALNEDEQDILMVLMRKIAREASRASENRAKEQARKASDEAKMAALETGEPVA